MPWRLFLSCPRHHQRERWSGHQSSGSSWGEYEVSNQRYVGGIGYSLTNILLLCNHFGGLFSWAVTVAEHLVAGVASLTNVTKRAGCTINILWNLDIVSCKWMFSSCSILCRSGPPGPTQAVRLHHLHPRLACLSLPVSSYRGTFPCRPLQFFPCTLPGRSCHMSSHFSHILDQLWEDIGKAGLQGIVFVVNKYIMSSSFFPH